MNDAYCFSKQRLARRLSEFDLKNDLGLYVAFSGGLDSTVLLHALISIKAMEKKRITALHVNHGLHKDAPVWEQECKRICNEWDVHFLSHRLDLSGASKSGIESTARKARYSWFEQQLTEKDVLVTAHHLDDQVETILANLFRGAGLHGLKGIPQKRSLGKGEVWRPLIDVERSALYDYAVRHRLKWVQDPANEDQRHTRNYLRHSVLPLIKKSWPGVAQTIARTAKNWQDTAMFLDEIAHHDLEDSCRSEREPFFMISVSDLNKLDELRCLNLLRFWIKQCGFQTPSRKHLKQLYVCMITVQPKTTTILSWPGVEVRRYRDWLYLSLPLPKKPHFHVSWSPDQSAIIDNRQLVAHPVVGRGIKRNIYDTSTITIRGRVGGERCWLPRHHNHQKLKKLFQQHGVPPWERGRIPLVYVDDKLAAVVGFWYCQPFAAEDGEPGMEFTLVDPIQHEKSNK